MTSESIVLRPFRDEEFDLLFDRLRGWKPEAVAADEEYWRTLTHKRVAESEDCAEDGIDFAVEFEGRLAGAVQAVGRYYRLPPSVYELGIEFFDERDRGRGLGGQVLRTFIPRIFANDAIRLQGRTHVSIRLRTRFSGRRLARLGDTGSRRHRAAPV